MAFKPDLENLQLILLTAALTADDGLLLPAPAHIAKYDIYVREAVSIIIGRGQADEFEVSDPKMSWRIDDKTMYGARINEAGREAVEINAPAPDQPEMQPARRGRKPIKKVVAEASPPPAPTKPARGKQAQVLKLLNRKSGASLADIMEATGWLAHSARAFLSGLRKKGHVVDRSTNVRGSVYRISKAG